MIWEKKGIIIFQGSVEPLPRCNPYLDKKAFTLKNKPITNVELEVDSLQI